MVRTKTHKKLLIALLAGAFGLVLMHVVTMYRTHNLEAHSIIALGNFDFDFGYWFNVDTERRFGALFGAILILFASGAMLFASFRFLSHKSFAVGWLFLSCVLLFMACDELFMIHERAGEFFGAEDHFGTAVIPAWVKAMAVVVAILCIPMGIFWWKLPRYLKIRTAVAAGVFLTGAVGVEILGMTHADASGINNFNYALLVALEEGMEMLGMIIAIDAMLLYLAKEKSDPVGQELPNAAQSAIA